MAKWRRALKWCSYFGSSSLLKHFQKDNFSLADSVVVCASFLCDPSQHRGKWSNLKKSNKHYLEEWFHRERLKELNTSSFVKAEVDGGMSPASKCLSNANLKDGKEILGLIHMGTSRNKWKEGRERLHIRKSCWQWRAETVQIFQNFRSYLKIIWKILINKLLGVSLY